MPRIALIALIVLATPAAAQRFQPSLPAAPRGVDYVESVCTGGFDGRYEQTRVLATGNVQKVTRRVPMVSTPVPRAEVDAIMRDLDRANFEQRSVPRLPPRIADGINCTLTRRRNGGQHSVILQQEAENLPAAQDLIRILGKVNALGRRTAVPAMRPIETP